MTHMFSLDCFGLWLFEDLPVDYVELILDLSLYAHFEIFLCWGFTSVKNNFICSQFGISSLLCNKLLRIKYYIGVVKVFNWLLHEFFGPCNLILFNVNFTVFLFEAKYPLCSSRVLKISKMSLNPVVPFLNFNILSLALCFFIGILYRMFLSCRFTLILALRMLGLLEILIGDTRRCLSFDLHIRRCKLILDL